MPTASITPSGPRPAVSSIRASATLSTSRVSSVSIPWRRAISSRSGTESTPMTRAAPRWRPIRAANWPTGPSPSTASVPSGGTSAYFTACQAVGRMSDRNRNRSSGARQGP